MIYEKEDMLLKADYYDWSSEDGVADPEIRNSDPEVFDKQNGFAVLQFVNRFCTHYNADVSNKNTCHRIETLLQSVPEEMIEPTMIAKWILMRWEDY